MQMSNKEIERRLERIQDDREFEDEMRFAVMDYRITRIEYDLDEAKDDYAQNYQLGGAVGKLHRSYLTWKINQLEKKLERMKRQYEDALSR